VKKVFESDNNTLATIIAKTVLTKFFTLYSSMKQPEKMMDVYFKRSILSGVRAKYVKDGKRVACRILTVKKEDCRLQIELKREKTIIDVSSPANVIIPKSIRLPKPKKARAQDEEQEEDESNEDNPDTHTDKNNDG